MLATIIVAFSLRMDLVVSLQMANKVVQERFYMDHQVVIFACIISSNLQVLWCSSSKSLRGITTLFILVTSMKALIQINLIYRGRALIFLVHAILLLKSIRLLKSI